ncbi:MAG: hypothetical protein HZB47_11550 [Nitrosomonadales bacterium]|nr:hypothetical protein [Nitrosomonadales bacterium]
MRRIANVTLLLAVLLLCAGQGWAESWQQAVSSRVTTEYETNPAMLAAHSGGVWLAVFEPGYRLTGRVGESEISTGLALQVARSSNKTLNPDRDSPSVFLNWMRQTGAGEFRIGTRYAELATRDAGGVDATGVPASSTRTSRAASGSWAMELSERASSSIDAAYERVSYNRGPYTDYSTRSGGVRINYVLSEQTTSFFRVSGNKYLPADGGPSSSLRNATLGMNWKFEYIDWSLEVGEARVGGGDAEREGSVEMHYAGQRAQMTLNAGRRVAPSGLGGFIKTDQATAGWHYALSEYSNAGIDLERQRNLSTTMGGDIVSTSSGVWLDHSLTPFWRTRTYYRHRTNRGGGVAGASSNLLGFSIAYDYSDF